MENKKYLLIAIVISAVFFGGAGYIIGKKTSSAVSPQGITRGNFTGGAQMGQNRMARMTGNGTIGEVLSQDGTSMTLKLRDGGSKIVFYSASTGVMRTASGTIADVTVGAQVSVTGTQNADGSVTAESIQLRPASAPAIFGR